MSQLPVVPITTSTTVAPTTTAPSTTIAPAPASNPAPSSFLGQVAATSSPNLTHDEVRALPAATLSAVNTVPAGRTIRLEGTGFVGGEAVQVIIASDPVVLAVVNAKQAGMVATTVTVPEEYYGSHTIALWAPESGRGSRQGITVTTEVLAATGEGAYAALGALMLLAGLGLAGAARRGGRAGDQGCY